MSCEFQLFVSGMDLGGGCRGCAPLPEMTYDFLIQLVLCSSRKYPYSPHRRDWNFLGGGGFYKAKKFKEMYEAELEFPEGWGGLRKNPFRGGSMDIFWNYTFCKKMWFIGVSYAIS